MFVKEVFEDEYFRLLTLCLITTISIEIKCEVNLIDRVLADLIPQYVILIYNPFQVYPQIRLAQILGCEKLHLLFSVLKSKKDSLNYIYY